MALGGEILPALIGQAFGELPEITTALLLICRGRKQASGALCPAGSGEA
jgi:hypothetical protein